MKFMVLAELYLKRDKDTLGQAIKENFTDIEYSNLNAVVDRLVENFKEYRKAGYTYSNLKIRITSVLSFANLWEITKQFVDQERELDEAST